MNRSILAAALLLASTALATLPAQALEFDFGGGLIPGNDTAFQSNAGTDLLVVGGPIPAGNQPLNVQCIICGTQQPQQDNGVFGYNNYQQGGNISQFAASSTSSFLANGHGPQLDNNTLGTGYAVDFLRAFLLNNQPGNISIGIDVNSGNTIEVLNRFVVVDLANHIILADTGVINMPLPTLNNGSGFPDYTITGFDLNAGDICGGQLIGCNVPNIAFLAKWSNTSDGAESFFLTSNVAAVPGPVVGAGPIGLAAAGLFGLNFWRRRRNGNTLPA